MKPSLWCCMFLLLMTYWLVTKLYLPRLCHTCTPEELAHLYTIYLKSEPALEKLSRLQFLLGIDYSMAAALQEMGDRNGPVGVEEENFVF